MPTLCEETHPEGFVCELPAHGPETLHFGTDKICRRSRYWSSDKLSRNRTTWRCA